MKQVLPANLSSVLMTGFLKTRYTRENITLKGTIEHINQNDNKAILFFADFQKVFVWTIHSCLYIKMNKVVLTVMQILVLMEISR